MAKVKLQFPKNYRSFTEDLEKFGKRNSKTISKLKLELYVIAYFVVIFGILIFSLDLLASFQKRKEINLQKEKIKNEIRVLEDVTSKLNNYREAYYKLAVLEFEIGEIDKAKFYLNKSLFIDPNFEKAREFQKVLNNY